MALPTDPGTHKVLEGFVQFADGEERVLGRLHSWWQFRFVSSLCSICVPPAVMLMYTFYSSYRGKSATRKKWDLEWGRVGKEGHIWWSGSTRANWQSTMGDKAWMWFRVSSSSPSTDGYKNDVTDLLPDDGLNYVPNPCFNAEGRWLPRKEWPVRLLPPFPQPLPQRLPLLPVHDNPARIDGCMQRVEDLLLKVSIRRAVTVGPVWEWRGERGDKCGEETVHGESAHGQRGGREG